MRQLTPFGEGPEFIIRDRDVKFGSEFDRVAKGAGIRVLKTAVNAPLMNLTVRVNEVDKYSEVDEHDSRSCAVNSTCERFLGSVRRECLDYIVILGQRHLQPVLGEYVDYFNASRPHQGIQQTVSAPASEEISTPSAKVVAFPVLNGLHHDYRRAA